jgi:integrase
MTTTPRKAKAPRIRRNLTDKMIEGVASFADNGPKVVWDSKVQELRVRIGRLRGNGTMGKVTWTYFAERKRRGVRKGLTTCRRLGHWPAMTVAMARKAARGLGGRIVDGRIEASAKNALTFADAFEDYCGHLLSKATAAGKEPRWHRNVVNLGKLYLKPKWDGCTLAEISRAPEDVRDWHRDVSKRAGAVTGNKCAKVLRATYRYAARLRRDLPSELPTSGVTMNPEEPREAGMTEAQHRKWAAAWRTIESPTRKAYQLLAVLTGQRPGELARVRVADAQDDALVIGKAKASNRIWIPASKPIKAALAMAMKARADTETEWLFPARAGNHIRKVDGDGLPLWGNGLRHNYKNIAVTMKPAVEEILTEFLQGHAPTGISRKYVSAMILAKSDALREAQERISERIVSLLGLTADDFRVRT